MTVTITPFRSECFKKSPSKFDPLSGSLLFRQRRRVSNDEVAVAEIKIVLVAACAQSPGVLTALGKIKSVALDIGVRRYIDISICGQCERDVACLCAARKLC